MSLSNHIAMEVWTVEGRADDSRTCFDSGMDMKLKWAT
jgi:hypothetical protein